MLIIVCISIYSALYCIHTIVKIVKNTCAEKVKLVFVQILVSITLNRGSGILKQIIFLRSTKNKV